MKKEDAIQWFIEVSKLHCNKEPYAMAINALQKEVQIEEIAEAQDRIAEIHFLPVCSKCNQILWETIDCKEEPPYYVGQRERYYVPNCIISPERCPYCKRPFEKIVMPTKLPFNNDM